MTAQEFVEKWPDTKPNSNCLVDMACPECGQRDYFRIECGSLCRVGDDGIERTEYDTEWDCNSFCLCGVCEADGLVAKFVIDGLDELLESKPIVISDNLLNDPAFAAKIGGAS